MGRQIPVRTFGDWNRPPPGFLEIDLVSHCGGTLSGSFIHGLVATDICTGWTEAIPLLAREQSLVVEGQEAIAKQLPFPVLGIDSDNDSAFINETLCSTASNGESNSPGPGLTARMTRHGSSRKTVRLSGGSLDTTATLAKSLDRRWSTCTRR